MAEDEDDSQKTEEPTQRRIEEALKKGQQIYSRELTNFLMLLALVLSIVWSGPYIMRHATIDLRYVIENAGQLSVGEREAGAILKKTVGEMMLLLLLPVILAAMMAIFSSLMQHGGFSINYEGIIPKWEKVSPMKGLKRMFSMRSFVEFLKGIVKLIVVGIVSWMAVYPKLEPIKLLHTYSLAAIMEFLLSLIMRMMIGICIVMGFLALLDYLYQRHEFYKGLRMSKHDLKEEYKQTEGSPEIKAKLRAIRMERARKRMMAAVPKADVIVTNPDHFSIALQYDSILMKAPKLVAKGQDNLAFVIRDIAKKHNIPIVENPPLARALYATVDLDQEIPAEHYKAVAEIITYVYKLKGKA